MGYHGPTIKCIHVFPEWMETDVVMGVNTRPPLPAYPVIKQHLRKTKLIWLTRRLAAAKQVDCFLLLNISGNKFSLNLYFYIWLHIFIHIRPNQIPFVINTTCNDNDGKIYPSVPSKYKKLISHSIKLFFIKVVVEYTLKSIA